jgi:hypothetical protein
MKHGIFILAWSFVVQVPVMCWWGWYAAQINVPPVLFVLSAFYGVVALALVPWVVKWLRPQWFAEARS